MNSTEFMQVQLQVTQKPALAWGNRLLWQITVFKPQISIMSDNEGKRNFK